MRLRALAFTVVLLLAACSKVTQENFAKIQDGMTEQEVTTILGSPTETSSGSILGISGTSSKWTGGDATISIRFVNGKVALRSFDKPGKKP
jgi:SmpA / OmlA family